VKTITQDSETLHKVPTCTPRNNWFLAFWYLFWKNQSFHNWNHGVGKHGHSKRSCNTHHRSTGMEKNQKWLIYLRAQNNGKIRYAQSS